MFSSMSIANLTRGNQGSGLIAQSLKAVQSSKVLEDRIPELSPFYVSSSINADSIPCIIKGKVFDGKSHEQQGRQCMEVFKSGVDILSLGVFVEKGEEIPTLCEHAEYVQHFFKVREEELEAFVETIELKGKRAWSLESQIRDVEKDLDEKQGMAKTASEVLANLLSAESGGSKQQKKAEEDQIAANKVKEDIVGELKEVRKEYNKLLEDLDRIKGDKNAAVSKLGRLKEEVRDKARLRFNEDTQALERLRKQFSTLTTFLSKIFLACSHFEEKCRDMGTWKHDPYAAGEYHRVFLNMKKAYGHEDELSMVGFLVAAMRKLQQDSQSLSQFKGKTDEIYNYLVESKVDSISTSDLTALLFLAGAKPEVRVDFFKSESVLKLATEHVESLEGSLSGSVSGGGKTNLYGRVRTFCQLREEQETLKKNFGDGRENERSKESQVKRAQLKTDADNREVFVALKRSGECFKFKMEGACAKGNECRFSHGEDKRKLPCWKFADGTCKRGDDCKYSHESSEKAGGGAASSKPVNGEKKKAQVNNVSKAAFDGYMKKGGNSSDDSSVSSNVVTISSKGSAIKVCQVSGVKLNTDLVWDTGSAVDVTSDPRVVSNRKKPDQDIIASGLGGRKKIDAIGTSELFQLEDMMLIEDGDIPNIMSVSKDTDMSTGKPQTVYILDSQGGVRFHPTDKDIGILKNMMKNADRDDRVKGRAAVKNGLYIESFRQKAKKMMSEKIISEASVQGMSSFVITKLYGGRVQFDSVQSTIGMLLAAGVSASALKHGVEYGTILGLPKSITGQEVDEYMKYFGPEINQLEAGIVQAPLVIPLDYVKETATQDGEVLSMDAILPSYSYLAVEVEKNGVKKIVKQRVKSIGGFADCVSIKDEYSGFAQCVGRVSKKYPEKIVKKAIETFIMRWRCLRKAKMDKEFVTVASLQVIHDVSLQNGLQLIEVKMPPPGDHQRGLGMSEGSSRWLQQTAHGSLIRAEAVFKEEGISEREGVSFWYHATVHSHFVSNCMPHKNDLYQSRQQAGTGKVFNLSSTPILPFCMRLVGKKLRNDERGRGERLLYLHPSGVCEGGIVAYSPRNKSISVKYAFIPCDSAPSMREEDLISGKKQLYGDLLRVIEDVPDLIGRGSEVIEDEVIEGDVVEVVSDDELEVSPAVVLSGGDVEDVNADIPTTERVSSQQEISDASIVEKIVSGEARLEETGRRKREFKIEMQKENPYKKYYGRGSAAVNNVLNIDVRPPKPKLPTKSQAKRMDNWKDAYRREYSKHIDEKCYQKLPRDSRGEFILPDGAITLNLLDIFEFKWKEWPKGSGEMKWLETVRAVLDGSKDTSNLDFYAETPSRTVLLFMISCGLSSGCYTLVSDAVRAYLKAKSLQRNIVVRFPECVIELDMGFERLMLMDKGVYGSISGALSWEVFFDGNAVDKLKFSKCIMAASAYIKENGEDVVRMLRHSDDVMMQGKILERVIGECGKLSAEIEMSPWTEMEIFLGAEIEIYGNIGCLRQRTKINEAGEKFNDLFLQYNPKRRLRGSPLPWNALEEDDSLHQDELVKLDSRMITKYQEMVGIANWICSIRMDGKFGYSVIAERQSSPREWDMRCAVWFLEFMVNTIDWPLVLGGDVLDIGAGSDGSHGNRRERRSTVAAGLRTGPISGYVCVEVSVIKVCVNSVFDVELIGGSRAIDMLSYGLNLCEDLKYKNAGSKKVLIDSESSVEWFRSKKINKKSKHLQMKYYHIRHSVQEGICVVEWIDGLENEIDMLTKVMTVRGNTRCARKLLGHCLLQGRGIIGIIELETGEVWLSVLHEES